MALGRRSLLQEEQKTDTMAKWNRSAGDVFPANKQRRSTFAGPYHFPAQASAHTCMPHALL